MLRISGTAFLPRHTLFHVHPCIKQRLARQTQDAGVREKVRVGGGAGGGSWDDERMGISQPRKIY